MRASILVDCFLVVVAVVEGCMEILYWHFSFFIDCDVPLLLGECGRMSGGTLVLHFLGITFLDFAFFIFH